jgi:hypothetical protein
MIALVGISSCSKSTSAPTIASLAACTSSTFTVALECRLEEFQRLNLPDTAFLPMSAQLRAQKKLQCLWLDTELGRQIANEVRRRVLPNV